MCVSTLLTVRCAVEFHWRFVSSFPPRCKVTLRFSCRDSGFQHRGCTTLGGNSAAVLIKIPCPYTLTTKTSFSGWHRRPARLLIAHHALTSHHASQFEQQSPQITPLWGGEFHVPLCAASRLTLERSSRGWRPAHLIRRLDTQRCFRGAEGPTATPSSSSVLGLHWRLFAAHDCDISRRVLATCAPRWCEVWHGGFGVAFVSDTTSTRRYGAPCVTGKYISLFLHFTVDRSPAAPWLCCALLAAHTSAYWLCSTSFVETPAEGFQAVMGSSDCLSHTPSNHCQCCIQITLLHFLIHAQSVQSTFNMSHDTLWILTW